MQDEGFSIFVPKVTVHDNNTVIFGELQKGEAFEVVGTGIFVKTTQSDDRYTKPMNCMWLQCTYDPKLNNLGQLAHLDRTTKVIRRRVTVEL